MCTLSQHALFTAEQALISDRRTDRVLVYLFIFIRDGTEFESIWKQTDRDLKGRCPVRLLSFLKKVERFTWCIVETKGVHQDFLLSNGTKNAHIHYHEH